MPSSGIFSGSIRVLEKTLDTSSIRHKVLTANIANLDTPNYKAFEVVMEEELNRGGHLSRNIQLVRTRSEHLPKRPQRTNNLRLKVADPPELSLRADGNTVDIDKTMGKMAENTIMYKAAAQIISKKLSGLKNAIQGGGK